MMRILCVIPSRLASTRLPRKSLADIQGKPMVQWVYEKAVACSAIHKTVVATDSLEIASVITEIGGEVVMTDPAIKTGSDRVAVAAAQFENYDVVINLQGDEPFIRPEMLDILVKPFSQDKKLEMSTLASPLDDLAYQSPDVVKVMTNQNAEAIYFSRSPIPYLRQDIELSRLPVYHHQGVYAFRRDFLNHYTTLPQTPLELAESIECLRALEHGHKIKVCTTPFQTLEINTKEELIRAQTFSAVSAF